MPWEDVKAVFRPNSVHMGVMKIDEESCTSCGLCMENCLLRCWEADENGIPHLKAKYECFSCFNCMIPCAVDAVSIVESYHVHDGPLTTVPTPDVPVKLPLEPRDAEGKIADYNTVERMVFERRSVRNYRNRPVPEPLIRRVLEAGRHAPTAGNSQPFQFVVVTDKALIKEMNEVILAGLTGLYNTYMDDEKVKTLAAAYEANPASNPGSWDPRMIQGGVGSLVRNRIEPLLGAPVVILICCDERAIGGAQMQVGIAGQNMVLVAQSLGLGSCWLGFAGGINASPAILEKLDIKPPMRMTCGVVLGYPKFKQVGMVPRIFRPIKWYRDGANKLEYEE